MPSRLLKRACAFAVLLAIAQAAFAQTPATVQLQDLTWTELRAQIHAGKTTVIIPIGGTEQSGPYIAVGKHNRRDHGNCEREKHRDLHGLSGIAVVRPP